MSRPKPQLREGAVDGWQSAQEFKDIARAWAEKIRVKPARIQVQRMTQKWASCSPGGVVTFSTDLLSEDRSFGEAVIVHELIHLKVPNHGPVFRSLLKAYLPSGDDRVIERLSCGFGGRPTARATQQASAGPASKSAPPSRTRSS